MPYAFPGQAIVGRDGRRVVVGGGSVVVRTYADFQAHIATLAPSSRAWATNASLSGKYRTVANTNSLSSASMYGSPWNAYFGDVAAPARVLQHALKDQATWQAQRDGGLEIYFEVQSLAPGFFNAIDRNGYLSLSDFSNTISSRSCTRLIRWDQALGKAFESNPSIGGAETEYTW